MGERRIRHWEAYLCLLLNNSQDFLSRKLDYRSIFKKMESKNPWHMFDEIWQREIGIISNTDGPTYLYSSLSPNASTTSGYVSITLRAATFMRLRPRTSFGFLNSCTSENLEKHFDSGSVRYIEILIQPEQRGIRSA
jgi:hypothetical protein